MGLKKTLKKVAKTVAKAAPVALLAAAAMKGKNKSGWITKKKQSRFAPDWSLQPEYEKPNSMRDVTGEVGEYGQRPWEDSSYKKGGLVKKGKPKLAKRGWK